MLLLGFFLVSMVFATRSELMINNYAVNIRNNVLRGVQATRQPSDELNLSGLGIQQIEESAFNNLIDLKSLLLANNSLYDLPPFLFSKLINLEHLSLAENSLDRFTNVFVGLANLKSLNVSKNLIKSFEPGELYGLSNTVDVIVHGNSLEMICTALFEKNSKERPKSMNRERFKRDVADSEPGFRIKVCIHQGIVKQLDHLKDNEAVPSDCREVGTHYSYTITLYLDNLNISGFERGWYRVETPLGRQIKISLRNNDIVRPTEEMLNDLPSGVWFVDLTGNKIERLENGVIVNRYVLVLNLTKNYLREIEDGALTNTKITDLYLDDNRLMDLKFMATLPSTIREVCLKRNRINELLEGSDLKLWTLGYFYLDGNNVTALRKDSLRGLPALYDFGLSDNRITTMEPGCFQDLISLEFLSLRNNRIDNIVNGVFDGPMHLTFIDMSQNKLTKIRENNLPHNLSLLLLDFNEIDSLEPGSFANMPYNQLSLKGNRITEIPKGAFNVPNQHGLREIDHYELTEGLEHFIERSFAKNIQWNDKTMLKLAKSLSHVDLSQNPIKKLENGAFFGVRKHKTNWIYVSESPIELIQGGLFNDV